jgi:hypothetical protein
MSTAIDFTLDDFGRCPQCGGYDEILDLASEHWVVCHIHKAKWRYGIGIFDDWGNQSVLELIANQTTLAGYERVTPINCGFGRGTDLTPQEWVQVILNRTKAEVMRELRDREPPF